VRSNKIAILDDSTVATLINYPMIAEIIHWISILQIDAVNFVYYAKSSCTKEFSPFDFYQPGISEKMNRKSK
jgi:hypothetical protein